MYKIIPFDQQPHGKITTFCPCPLHPHLHQPRALSRLPLHSEIAGSTGLGLPPHLQTIRKKSKTKCYGKYQWSAKAGPCFRCWPQRNQNCSAPLSAPVKITCFAPSLMPACHRHRGTLAPISQNRNVCWPKTPETADLGIC